MNKVTFSKIDENQVNKSVCNGSRASSEKSGATIIFSLKNEIGGLIKALKFFQVSVSFEI